MISDKYNHISSLIFTNIFIILYTTISTAQNSNGLIISDIHFIGNNIFSSRQISDMMISKTGNKYSSEQFELDLKNILRNYQNEGYINCLLHNVTEIFNQDSTSVNLNFTIKENNQVTVGEIIFEGNRLFSDKQLSSVIYTKIGNILNNNTLNQDMNELLSIYDKKGYSFASISIKNIETYSNNGKEYFRIIIQIDENEKIKINRIVVEGNTDTKTSVIVREVRLGKNNTVTKEAIEKIKRRLDNLGYFESVELPKIMNYKNSTVLLIKVKEGNTNTFDGIIGYIPSTTNDDEGYFTGLVDLSLRNLFGTGRRLDARWQKETKTTQELEFKYTEPWIFGLPVNVNLGFAQRIQDSTYIKRTVNVKTETGISSNLTLSLVGGYERVIPSIDDNMQSSGVLIFNSRLLSAGFEVKIDTRDYIYNPTSGILYRINYIAGQKKIYNYYDFTSYNIPSEFTVQKGVINLENYFSFFKRQSLLIGFHGGEIRSTKTDIADMFRIGGSNSVRGYREDQFIATRVIWSNIELRYSLTRKTFASLFYDYGYFKKPADEIYNIVEQSGFIFGYGAGVRVETPLGIFGVNYALGKGDTILEGKIHFGIINDF